MSYYNRYRNRKRPGQIGSNDQPAGGEIGHETAELNAIFDLGKNKRVTVRQFRNINLIDIREYYLDSASGEMKPGKKGISLTEDVYDELLLHRQNIDDALRRLGSRRPRTKTVNVLDDEVAAGRGVVSTGASRETSEAPRPKKPKREVSRQVTPAPPQGTPDAENRLKNERESRAQLVVPTSNNNPRLDDHMPIPSKTVTEESDLDGSDEDFALALESEVKDVNDANSSEEE
ncbi:LAMI_0D00936g1_1 [Lachancea mirantina]|uniref:LAMI_0D00936g1_1 n=1 Tax=Lachancea mirantina TaxID=1230905 RepID=A0A1G4J8R2_9SACH|nr:LAMI_0D00936g1_1 [Lachancea mirantina]